MTAATGFAALSRATAIGSIPDDGRAPRFSREFVVAAGHGEVVRATLNATGHGIIDARLNGTAVTDDLFAPGWTDYNSRLLVCTWDVTDLLAATNELSLIVGNGWWRGNLGAGEHQAIYGARLAVVASVTIEYADGHVQEVPTDLDWNATASAIVTNSIYDGQTVDYTLEPEEFAVVAVDFDRTVLQPAVAAPVRRQERIAPARIWASKAGTILVDFGQNLVGWVQLKCPADRGRSIQLRHSEVLIDGELATAPLRSARATDVVVLGDEPLSFEPTFTYHGFRYVEVTGWVGELTNEDIAAVVVHSDMRRTGSFACSDELLNKLISNAVWSQRGNFFSIPTDCPQRDERLGWTGDIAVFAPSAAFSFDVSDFLHSWLIDLKSESDAAGGAVPLVIPNVIKHMDLPEGSQGAPYAVWGDAAVWVAEALWEAYADEGRLAAQYPGMRLHLESVVSVLSPTGLWDTGFQFGDWLDPDAPADEPSKSKADPAVVATACLFRSAAFAARAADLLGYRDDAERYRSLAERTRSAFNEHYVMADGRITSDCATVYALAIQFNLLDPALEAAAGDRLAAIVCRDEYKITTGFAGTPYLLWALTRTGHDQEAFALLTQTECPSWLYMVDQGATTMWERWDSLRPDGTLNSGEMTSFNHYAFGSILDWLRQVLGGLQATEPGYSAVRFAPRPGGGVQWCRTSFESRRGPISCDWRIEGADLVVDLEVPMGVRASLCLPGCPEIEVSAGATTYRGPLPTKEPTFPALHHSEI